MGLINLFRKTKNKTLLLGEGKINNEKQQENKEIDVQIFSKKMDDKNIEYSIILNSEGNRILVGKIHNSLTDNNVKRGAVDLKNAAHKIKEAMNSIAIVNAKSQYAIDKAKSEAKEKIQRVANKEGVTLTQEIMQYINQYKDSSKDYRKTEDKTKKMSEADRKRLQELENIKTPEDAFAHRNSLIAYMKRTENVPGNPIVEANIRSLQEGKKLDDETVKRIAQNMEDLSNEDGLLYSVYLKIEEKRIWRQLETRVAQYSNNSSDTEIINEVYQLSKLIEELDKYELPDIGEGFSPSVLEYIISEMKEKNVENYIENIKEKDISLARNINTKCHGIEDKTEMLQFLYARIGSLGQLSYKSVSKGRDILRNFIANTDFKHEDNSETKQFLWMVANIEKEYIQSQYSTDSNGYDKRKDKPLKERISVQTAPIINLSERQKYAYREQEEKDRTA